MLSRVTRVARKSTRAGVRNITVTKGFEGDAAKSTQTTTIEQRLANVHPEVAWKLAKELYIAKKNMPRLQNRNTKKGFLTKILPIVGEYQQWGFRFDDLTSDTLAVHEAITRMPKSVQEARTNRIWNGLVHQTYQRPCPEEWQTKKEDDIPDLTPYLEEHIRETKARESFRGKVII